MVKQANGIYRWTYELNLYRNPTVLITVLKVLGLSMGLVWLFVVLVSMGDRGFWWDGFLPETKVFALVMLGFVVLGAVSYYLYALIQGGRYCVLFEMDEQGVKHTQLARQFRKSQVVAALTKQGKALSKSDAHNLARLEAAKGHYEAVMKTFDDIGTGKMPSEDWDDAIRTTTGGRGISEAINDMADLFKSLVL